MQLYPENLPAVYVTGNDILFVHAITAILQKAPFFIRDIFPARPFSITSFKLTPGQDSYLFVHACGITKQTEIKKVTEGYSQSFSKVFVFSFQKPGEHKKFGFIKKNTLYIDLALPMKELYRGTGRRINKRPGSNNRGRCNT